MKTSCEFHFGLIDVTARGDAELSVSQNQPWADINDTNLFDDPENPNVETLEPGFGWPLDGTKDWFPDNPYDVDFGWWSTEQSGEDGSFVAPPTLTVDFSQNHSAAGITLYFDGTVPQSIHIAWKDLSGVQMSEQTFYPDTLEYACLHQVENFGGLVISVLGMQHPHRFMRCRHIIFGTEEVFGSKMVEKATLTEEINITAEALPIGVLNLQFYSSTGRFSLFTPGTAHRLLQFRQPIDAFAQLDEETRFMGRYYFDSAEATLSKSTSMRFVDLIGVLDTVFFDGGIYVDKPLSELLAEILAPEGIEPEIHESFASAALSGHLPHASKRYALQQIALAIGAIVDTSRSTEVRVYPLPTNAARSTIPPSRKEQWHKVTWEPLVSRVDVTAHSFTLSTEAKELTKVTLGAGQHRIDLSNPAQVDSITSGSILSQTPNFVEVQAAGGEVILTGREYLDAPVIYSAGMENLPAGSKVSILEVHDCFLMDATKAQAAAQRLFEHYQLRYVDEGRLLPGAEMLGQRTAIEHSDGQALTGNIERLHIELTGGYLQKITMRGGA